MELTEEKSGAASNPICKDLLIYRPPFRWIGVGVAFTVKARRAESETEPRRFVGTGPRTVDSDSRRSPDRGAAPVGEAMPDRPAAALDEPGAEVTDRSCPLVAGRGRARARPSLEAEAPCEGLTAVEVPELLGAELLGAELLGAGLPVMRLLAAGVPAAGVAGAGLPVAEWPVAGAADPPEVRSWPGPAPAAGAVGCSEVAGGRTSVEVDLSVCVGF